MLMCVDLVAVGYCISMFTLLEDRTQPKDSRNCLDIRRETARIQIRKSHNKRLLADKRAIFFEKFRSNIQQADIIDPLTKFITLAPDTLAQSLADLEREIEDESFNLKLMNIGFHKVLLNILRESKEIKTKSAIMQALDNLTFFCYDTLLENIIDLQVMPLLVAEINNITCGTVEECEYLTRIVCLVRNLSTVADDKFCDNLISNDYFSSVIDKCMEVPSGDHLRFEEAKRTMRQLVRSMQTMIKHKLLKEGVLLQLLDFVLLNVQWKDQLIDIIEQCNLIHAIIRALSTKVLGELCQKTHFLKEILELISTYEKNPSIELQLCIIKILKQFAQKEVQESSSELCSLVIQFLPCCITSPVEEVKQPSIALLAKVYFDLEKNIRFEQELAQQIARQVIRGLISNNNQLYSYLDLLQKMCLGVEWEKIPEILLKSNVLQRLEYLMADTLHPDCMFLVLSSLCRLLDYRKDHSSNQPNNKVKLILQDMGMLGIFIAAQEIENKQVHAMAYELVEKFESTI